MSKHANIFKQRKNALCGYLCKSSPKMTHGHGMWENTNRQTAGTVSVDVSAELKGQAWRGTLEAACLA